MNGYHDCPADKARSELRAGADTVPGYDFPHLQHGAGPYCTGAQGIFPHVVLWR